MKSDSIQIRGLDLNIDKAVITQCKAFNSSSGATRSILYVFIIINVLSLIAVINTHKGNWSIARINSATSSLRDSVIRMSNKEFQSEADSIGLSIHIDNLKSKIFSLIKNRIENIQTVKVPLLGNSFDIDNLGLISGISFIILLIVLRFTLIREKNNGRIALQSISERYFDTIVEKQLQEEGIPKVRILFNSKTNKTEEIPSDDDIKREINKIRRQHHYNFLSMNEIFNLPHLEISENKIQNSVSGKIISDYLFYFPFYVYTLIFINDLITFNNGLEVAPIHTPLSSLISACCLIIISNLCLECSHQKRLIGKLFDSFYKNNYQYCKEETFNYVITWKKRMAYPAIIFHKTIVFLWKMRHPIF
jgi:hypothetical protein